MLGRDNGAFADESNGLQDNRGNIDLKLVPQQAPNSKLIIELLDIGAEPVLYDLD